MSDFDSEGLVDDALAELRAEALPFITPPGVDAARVVVRRRRRTRVAALSVLLAVLVLAPVAAFGSIDRHSRPTPLQPSPTASPSSSAPASPQGSPSAAPDSTPSAARPAGTDAPTDLADAYLTVPAWDGSDAACPSGRTTFTGGHSPWSGPARLTLLSTTAVDVDHDGGTETLAVIWCERSDTGAGVGPRQLVAIKAQPDGTLHTLGRVLRTTITDAADILDVAGAGGRVQVTVADIVLCCATPKLQQLHQVRTFAWSGTAFRQIGGPTSFIADRDAADITVTASATVGAATNGKRSGTLTIVLHNHGPHAATQVSAEFEPQPYFSGTGGGSWSHCTALHTGDPAAVCQIGTIAAGGSYTLTLPLTTTAGPDFSDKWFVYVQPRTGTKKYPTSQGTIVWS